jgi:hypothetical protein
VELLIVGSLLAFCGLTRAAGADEAKWHPVKGRPCAGVPEQMFSAVVEIAVTHEHADGEPTVEYSSGTMINRHVWPGRSLMKYERITRDSPGQDETPDGTCLPLALFPRRRGVPWGGEMLTPEERNGAPSTDTRTRHQRQWDYIQGHVEKAFERYCAYYRGICHDPEGIQWPETGGSLPGLTVEEMTDWQKVNAICNYATTWQWRGHDKWMPYPSIHAVDVLHNGHYCTGVATAIEAMLHVAGFDARRLVWERHTATEVKVGDKWFYADIAYEREPGGRVGILGGELRSCVGWAEMRAEPDLMVTPIWHARKQSADKTTYLFAPMMYWQGMGGIDDHEKKGRERFHVATPAVNYDPQAATALYPTMRVHLFHLWKDEPPNTLALCRRRIGKHLKVAIEPGMAVRKRFYLSDCRDNPVTRGVARFSIPVAEGPGAVRCELDGADLGAGRRESGWAGWTTFEMSPERLTPGEHDLVLRNVSDKEITVAFQPDVVRPYCNPVSGKEIVLTPSDAGRP